MSSSAGGHLLLLRLRLRNCLLLPSSCDWCVAMQIAIQQRVQMLFTHDGGEEWAAIRKETDERQ